MDERTRLKIEAFFSQFQEMTYKKGEILINADENPSGIFYLKEGSVKQYVISRTGDEVVVNSFKSFSFFPLSWAIKKIPNRYFFEAMSDARGWKAPNDRVVEFLKQNSDVSFDLLARLYSGIDGLLERVVHLMSGNAENRLLTEIIILAKRAGKNSHDIRIPIAEKELAALSGLTRETVSRTIKTLKEKNLVQFNQGVLHIADLSLLEQEFV